MAYIYILKSAKSGSYYVGSCNDVRVRVDLHNRGVVKSTKRYLPWDLVYKEEFQELKEAKKREVQIKAWKSRSAIERLIAISKFDNKSRIHDFFGGPVV